LDTQLAFNYSVDFLRRVSSARDFVSSDLVDYQVELPSERLFLAVDSYADNFDIVYVCIYSRFIIYEYCYECLLHSMFFFLS
jgi:hypothetical protein